MIELHHLENSRSQRVLWLLEELGIDFEVVRYSRDPETQLAPASLRQLHPLGKAPLIRDLGRDERVLAESGAIIDYLVEHHDPQARLAPLPGSEAHERYRFWLHHAEGSAMPPLVMRLVFSRLGQPPVPTLARPLGRLFARGVEQQYLRPEIRRLAEFWTEELVTRGPWFAGESFSAADIQMSFPLLALESRGGLVEFPRLVDFLDACRERDAYRRTVDRIGEFGLG
ncbi:MULTISPECIES: glutathione S-transferase [unclassified Halomonas]|uniref:glutathione S-transferase family protein n=1 Tax=unclassified Halomonas TaxID=2609666 RepID=UPI002886054F|nr:MULTISPECIES: glutathione S-transferase [unclassified Halomonas]MDT0499594.1 glutathione S-transferase [Halomonas sp. PAR7]MDT0510589.1 glutathione S-transferase [Halomonas sp. LES1]MDT0592612.1 glutathione S-transferase [Halomonas sp. PAR8]